MEHRGDLLTLNEAGRRCRCSPDTIRRRIEDGTITGAVRDGDRANAPWLVSVQALAAAGLLSDMGATHQAELIESLRDEIVWLRGIVDLLVQHLPKPEKSDGG